MIAAIYARKSTDQTGVAEEARSVTTQVEHAKGFIASKGWTLGPIFQDDGISGAEFERRPGFVALMDALRPAPAFQALVMSEESRLGRSTDMVPYVLGRLTKAGVEVWCYRENRRVALTTPVEKFMVSATSFAADMERFLGRQRTTEKMEQKARLGHVIGARGFGHQNITVDGHGDLEVVEDERQVVKRIFELCATGNGYSRIAKVLNAEGARCPQPRRKGAPRGWSSSTVRGVLRNELHRGLLVQFKTKKRNNDGAVAPTTRPPSEWIRVDRPELRTVSDELWNGAHARLARTRTTLTLADDRRREVKRRDYDSSYLLTGHVRCTVCGGSITVVSRSHGKRRAYFYGCLTNWKRGATVCANDLVLPIDKVNHAVLAAIATDTLRPAVVTAIIDRYLERLLPTNVGTRVDELRRQLRVVDGKIANLTAAVEQGGNLPPIIMALAERQKERETLIADIGSAETLHQIQIDRVEIEAEVQNEVAQWRGLLSDSVIDGRELLRKVLAEPIQFTPEGKTYRFRGRTRMGAVIAGKVLPTCVASPTGFEPVFWP